MDIYDCVIIGGGPGGLMAGIYLSRFRCKICLIDSNDSRASLITTSHNFPGAIGGVSGNEILTDLKEQYAVYGNNIILDEVSEIFTERSSFLVKSSKNKWLTKTIILATGVIDIEPAVPGLESAIRKGLIRHCLICDGFEVINKRIAIIGEESKAISEAILLKVYSPMITVFLVPFKTLSEEGRRLAKKEKINVVEEPIYEVIKEKEKIIALKTLKQTYEFDTVYAALGIKPRTEFAINLGATHNEENILFVNQNQETSIQHLYAIGDIVAGLNQMIVAMAQGAIAAVSIFNSLQKDKIR